VDRQPIPWGLLRQSAAAACEGCDVARERFVSASEPGWTLFREQEGLAVDNPSHAGIPMPRWREMAQSVEGTCAVCAVRDMESVCGSCALIEFLRRVVRQVNGRSG